MAQAVHAALYRQNNDPFLNLVMAYVYITMKEYARCRGGKGINARNESFLLIGGMNYGNYR